MVAHKKGGRGSVMEFSLLPKYIRVTWQTLVFIKVLSRCIIGGELNYI